jgi:hypothetical protein
MTAGHLGSDLGQIVEAAEGDESGSSGGAGCYRGGIISGAVAEEAALESDQLLDKCLRTLR